MTAPAPAPRWREQQVSVGRGRTVRALVAGPAPRGAEETAIVLESGLGAGAATWGPVSALTSARVRTLAYDRAGYGASAPARDGRSLDDLAADLTAVVTASGTDRAVLVGHSWGGAIVRRFAQREPERVAGLVLVDPVDEHAAVYFSRAAALSSAVQRALVPLLARAGMMDRSVRATLAGLDEPLLTEAAAASASMDAARTMGAEDAQLLAGLRTLRESGARRATYPVVVISGQLSGRFDRWIRTDLSAAHRATAARYGGRYVPAHSSGHMIPVTEPALVAAHAVGMAAG